MAMVQNGRVQKNDPLAHMLKTHYFGQIFNPRLRDKQINAHIDGVRLGVATETKFLWVIVQKNFRWNSLTHGRYEARS